jgi:hypothetical protein
MRRLTALSLAATMALAAAGCGDDDSVLGLDSTTAAPATTAAPPPTAATTRPPPTTRPPATTTPTTTMALTTTTPTTVAPTTTLAPTTTAGPYYGPPPPFFPDPLPGSDQAHGSGCVLAPGATTLPDGIWFGMAEAYAPGTLTLDLACFWTGQAAVDKAADDGVEAYDFYVRNVNPLTFPVPVAPSARVWYIDASSGNVQAPDEIPLAGWPHPDSFLGCPGEWCSVWIYVNDGELTALVEQYLP